MATPYTVIAFLYPRPEKLDRVSESATPFNKSLISAIHHPIPNLITISQAMEILGELINLVEESEPDAIAYEWYKSVDDAGTLRLTIIERYIDRTVSGSW